MSGKLPAKNLTDKNKNIKRFPRWGAIIVFWPLAKRTSQTRGCIKKTIIGIKKNINRHQKKNIKGSCKEGKKGGGRKEGRREGGEEGSKGGRRGRKEGRR